MTPEEKITALGLVLPAPPKPASNYVPYRLVGNMIYTSGHGPRAPDGGFVVGRLGQNITVDEGYRAARDVGLQLLAVAKSAIGDLSRIECVVKVLGMVNAVPDFDQHAQVINGCSDLMGTILGEAGGHARSAVGMGSLPFGMVVEIEAIFQVKN